MTTKRQILNKAYASVGLGNWEYDLQPDEIQDTLSSLDAMMALWSSKGIRMGYNGEGKDLDDDSGVPDVGLMAVYMNLAVIIAPTIGRQLSAITMALASAAYDSAVATFMSIPQVQYPGTLPRGAGNKPLRYGTFQQYYPFPQQTVDVGQDANLELNK